MHFAWDAALAEIIPHCPAGSKLNTDKSRGNLNVVIGRRFHTVCTVEIDSNTEGQFNISGPRKGGSFKLPEYITDSMLQAMVTMAKKEPIFN